MIVTGTSIGRIFVFNYNKQKIDARFGEAALLSATKLLKMTESEEYVIFANQNGVIGKQNLNNAFDGMSFDVGLTNLSSASYLKEDNTVVFSSSNGQISKVNLDKPEEEK